MSVRADSGLADAYPDVSGITPSRATPERALRSACKVRRIKVVGTSKPEASLRCREAMIRCAEKLEICEQYDKNESLLHGIRRATKIARKNERNT